MRRHHSGNMDERYNAPQKQPYYRTIYIYMSIINQKKLRIILKTEINRNWPHLFVKTINQSVHRHWSNVREQFNAANKEIEKQFSVAARQLNLSQYFESDQSQTGSTQSTSTGQHHGNEENSSEDSLMEERHRKSNSLPRPPR